MEWLSRMPLTIEAIFGHRGVHSAFLRRFGAQYGLNEENWPLLQLDVNNWERPLSEAS